MSEPAGAVAESRADLLRGRVSGEGRIEGPPKSDSSTCCSDISSGHRGRVAETLFHHGVETVVLDAGHRHSNPPKRL